MELAPPSLVKLTKTPEVQAISMWGNTPDCVRTSHELLGLAALKFVCRGAKEITAISYKHAMEVMEEICSKDDVPCPRAKQGLPLLRVLSSFLHEHLDKKGLAHVAEIPGLVAFRATCPPGSLCYMPSGYIFSERSLNGQLSYGWRASMVESASVEPFLRNLVDQGCMGNMAVQVLQKVLKEMGSQYSSSPGVVRPCVTAEQSGSGLPALLDKPEEEKSKEEAARAANAGSEAKAKSKAEAEAKAKAEAKVKADLEAKAKADAEAVEASKDAKASKRKPSEVVVAPPSKRARSKQ